MTKYYYDCPIKAAYMAKYFGVKLQILVANESECQLYSWFYNMALPSGAGKNLYIHPNSLHILEPQVGDLIKEYGAPLYRYLDGKLSNGDFTAYKNKYDIKFDEVARIVERNNIPFIYPEIED